MNKCKYCHGKFKLVKKEYVVRSRNKDKSETIIEDLKMLVCTVCSHTELTESSEKYVEYIRAKFRNELTSQVSQNNLESTQTKIEPAKKEKLNMSFIKDTILKWIG